MKRGQFTPEKIIGLLRQVEVELAQGKRVGEVCRAVWGSQNKVTTAGALSTAV